MAFPVFFLCTSHQHWRTKREKKKPRLPTISPSPTPPPTKAAAEKTAAATSKGGRKLVSSLSGLGSRVLQVTKVMSWKNKERGGDEEAVWKKTILMGDKCQPLNFSGRIAYDSKGKLVQGFPLNDDNARCAVAAA